MHNRGVYIIAITIQHVRAKQSTRVFTVIDLMNNRAVHGVRAGQQSPIFHLLFSPEENHDRSVLTGEFYKILFVRTTDNNYSRALDKRSISHFRAVLFHILFCHIFFSLMIYKTFHLFAFENRIASP